jgi:hypothetical protein
MAVRPVVNRMVVGSSPTRYATFGDTMNVNELAKTLWDDVADSVKRTLTPEQVTVAKESAQHIAKFYVWSVTNQATEMDHKAVKAIVANLKSVATTAVVASFKATLVRVGEKAIALAFVA